MTDGCGHQRRRRRNPEFNVEVHKSTSPEHLTRQQTDHRNNRTTQQHSKQAGALSSCHLGHDDTRVGPSQYPENRCPQGKAVGSLNTSPTGTRKSTHGCSSQHRSGAVFRTTSTSTLHFLPQVTFFTCSELQDPSSQENPQHAESSQTVQASGTCETTGTMNETSGTSETNASGKSETSVASADGELLTLRHQFSRPRISHG